MNTLGNIIFLIVSSLLLFGLAMFIVKNTIAERSLDRDSETVVTNTWSDTSLSWKVWEQEIIPVPVLEEETTEENDPPPTELVLIEWVPFTSQAPYNNWENSVYEEWCEEASMLMAVYWTRWQQITPEIAHTEIQKIADYEKELFWVFHDTTVSDTAKVMEGYFSFTGYTVREDIETSDMIESLKKWNILMVPMYGRALKNVYYTPPGPVPHMMVVVGYDARTGEFIANDPWTLHGEGYRYEKDMFFDAIWTYPTSHDVKLVPPNIGDIRKKSMIEIRK
jgi:Peptidase_C39 like family